MKERLQESASGRPVFFIRLFGTLLAVILLVYLLNQQGWGDIVDAVRKIPVWRFIAALGLIVISRLSVSARWHVLLKSAGVDISYIQSVRITYAGLFASNFLPTTIGGDVVRLAGALQFELDAAISTASLVVDRLVGMVGMAMVLPFGLPYYLEKYLSERSFSPSNINTIPQFALFSFGKWWKSFWNKGRNFFRRLLEALSLWIGRPRGLFAALAFSWVHMLCLFGAIWLLLGGLGESLSFWLLGGLYSLVYFVTLLPFSINGYGIQEVSMTFVLSAVGGASMQNGLTVALIFRTMMMLASLPGAVFIPGLMPGAENQTKVVRRTD